MSAASSNISVFVRVRPAADRRFPTVVEVPNTKELVVSDKSHARKTFRFSEVFGPASTQAQVYSSVVDPLVSDVLCGYQCTVFVYGQTGSGKTFTMQGRMPKVVDNNFSLDLHAGIIPRTVNSLFDELTRRQAIFSVRVSLLELYNEDVFDLLSPNQDPPKLKIFETKKKGVVINGLQELSVHNKLEVFQVLQKGCEKRQTAVTLMNAKSSRSHTIFTVSITIRKGDPLSGKETFSSCKMNLVDLAGSENVERSGAVEKRAREAGSINQSLLTLGRVISALVEGSPHIPYRESKLTRLLQQSLGGCTKTSIIATVSPSSCDWEETISTLDYAYRAKNVKNRPEVDIHVTKHAHLSELRSEIRMLQLDLEATMTGCGILVEQTSYDDMISSADAFDIELNEKCEHMNALLDQMMQVEAACEELTKRAALVQEKVEEVHAKQIEQNSVLSNTEKEVQKQKRENDICSYELMLKSKLQEGLSQHLQHLKNSAAKASMERQQLFEKLDREKAAGAQNMACIHDAQLEYSSINSMVEKKIDQLAEQSLSALVNFESKVKKDVQNYEAVVEDVFGDCRKIAESSENLVTIKERLDEVHRKVLPAQEIAGIHEIPEILKKQANFEHMVVPEMQSVFETSTSTIAEEMNIASIREACCAEQLTIVKKHFQEYKEVIEKPISKLRTLVVEEHETSQKSSMIFKEKKELFQENFHRKLAEIRTALAALGSLQEEWDSFVMERSQSKQERMSVLQMNVQSLTEEYCLDIKNIPLKNDACLRAYKQCSETMMSNINQILPKIKECDVVAKVDQIKQNYDVLAKFLAEVESSIQLQISQKSTSPEELKNICSSFHEILSPVWKLRDKVKCFENKILMNLPPSLSQLLVLIQELTENWCKGTENLLHEAFESVIDISMKESVPTGDTPQRVGSKRTNCNISRVLAAEDSHYSGSKCTDPISPILAPDDTYSVANVSFELLPSDDDCEDEGLPDLDRTFCLSKSSDESNEFRSLE